ncbi:Fis family transcriptional regulator [Limnohabitans sp. 103DPR2]|jgi:Fis family transcriptional regulator|uniref:Fis family transcriptional regulator n=1 Tax=Limnohabitans sp. 103DPR2 TaxID=1678129 RepID=UPI0006DC9890|nr:Fis family transcriptional regulator [Limnohabitans sp. 103DPR2]ALK92947.1 DNA-binding protein Fis [Limnohabitans sp. 103DPR2]MBU3723682.1 Fis family transcriptional regulator [Limnohabitans sp.]
MSKKKIEECIRDSLNAYFQDMDGVEPHGMYDMLLNAVEKPLLDVVMQQADQNQSRAAEWLGLNRNTLRKKLIEHKLLK